MGIPSSVSEEETVALKNEMIGSEQKHVVNDTVRIWIQVLMLLKKIAFKKKNPDFTLYNRNSNVTHPLRGKNFSSLLVSV